MSLKSFLLENKSVKQTILKNTFWLAFSQGVIKLIKLLLIIYVAKILSATEYGKFSYAMSFAGLFAVLVDMGINSIFVREMSSDSEKQKYFSSLLSFKIFLSFISFASIFGLSFLISRDPSVQLNIWILGLSVVLAGVASFFMSLFQAHQKMEIPIIGDILQALGTTVIGLILIFRVPLAQYLSFAYLIGSVILLMTAVFLTVFHKYSIGLSVDFRVWGEFLKMSWPLALGSLFINVFAATDSLMIGYMKNMEQVGFYNAAQRIMALAGLPVGFLATSFFPAISKAVGQGKEALQKIFDFEIEIFLMIALPIFCGGLILAPRLIDYVYDPKFYPAVLVFRMLCFVILFHYISYPFNQILIAHNRQQWTFWITVGTSMLDIILNLIFIPQYGLYGATFTTIISACVSLAVLMAIFGKFGFVRILDFKTIKVFLTSCLACIAMYFVLVNPYVFNANIFVSVPIGIMAYFSVFLGFSRIVGGDFGLLKSVSNYLLEKKGE